MSTRPHTQVCCDVPGCPTMFMAAGRAHEVRRAAVEEGWRVTSGGDFCPGHYLRTARPAPLNGDQTP